MFKHKRLFIIPGIVISSVAVISSAISCKNNDSNKFLVTLHAGNGHTINGQNKYSFKTKEDVEYEPTPDAKEGSSFIGWYKNDKLTGDKVTFPLKVTENIDLYADYNLYFNSFAVTFVSNGGSSVPTYNIKEGDKINAEPVTIKDDYKFYGWFDNSELSGTKVTFPYTPTKNTTLYAKWNEIDKGGTLTLNTNGGTAPSGNFEAVSGQSYVYKTKGLTKSILVAPSTTQESKTFEGWYKNSSLEEESKVKDSDFPITINKDQDLNWYAKWSDKTTGHAVTLFDKDKTKIKDITNTCRIAYSPEAPSVEHYKFKEWQDSSKNKVDFPLDVTEDIKLYAIYDENQKCDITLKDVDGTTTIGETITVDKGQSINSPFKYEGSCADYGSFNGWKNGTSLITYPYTVPNVDSLTLTADVSINSAIINIYNSENDKLIKSIGNIKSLEEQPKVSIGDRPEDYVLDYLSTTKDSTGKISTYPFVVSNHKDLIKNHEIKLYAIWDQNNRYYNITLKYGTGYNDYLIKHQKSGSTIYRVNLPIVTHEDKQITGWKDEDNNPVGESFVISKDRTLTAVWEVTHTKLKVHRASGSTDTYEHMSKSLLLNNVPKVAKSCHELVGYTINGETPQTTHPLSETITLKDDGTTEITEVFNRVATKLTIKYNNEAQGITGISDRIIEEQTLTFSVSSLPKETYLDFEITGFKYKEKTYELNESITLDGVDSNEITAIWKQTAFTVTFDYNDTTAKGKVHKLEHVSKLTSDNIPTLSLEGKRLIGYSQTPDGDVINLVNKDVTSDVTYYAKWTAASEKFKVTFHLGSLQASAKFNDTTITGRSTSIEGTTALNFDDCPVCSCNGCAFMGWYLSENDDTQPVYPLTTTQTLYARWTPYSGFITVCLNITDGGIFKETGSSSTLLTVEANKTEWSQITSSIPTIDFGDAFKVDYWKDKEGKKITDERTFSESTYLYSVNDEDIQTPTSFTNDNWPTFCSVAEQGLAQLKTTYASELVSDSFVGLTRKLTYRGEEFDVRVVGEKQDYDAANTSKKETLTFEFTKSISFETWDVNTYDKCQIRPKLYYKGQIYNGLQASLITKGTHILETKKYSQDGGNKNYDSYLFLPSYYELKLTSVTYTNNFTYAYYSSATNEKRIKQYANVGNCTYWCRDANGSHPYYVDYDGSSEDASSIPVGRAIAPMFCVGKAES